MGKKRTNRLKFITSSKKKNRKINLKGARACVCRMLSSYGNTCESGDVSFSSILSWFFRLGFSLKTPSSRCACGPVARIVGSKQRPKNAHSHQEQWFPNKYIINYEYVRHVDFGTSPKTLENVVCNTTHFGGRHRPTIEYPWSGDVIELIESLVLTSFFNQFQAMHHFLHNKFAAAARDLRMVVVGVFPILPEMHCQSCSQINFFSLFELRLQMLVRLSNRLNAARYPCGAAFVPLLPITSPLARGHCFFFGVQNIKQNWDKTPESAYLFAILDLSSGIQTRYDWQSTKFGRFVGSFAALYPFRAVFFRFPLSQAAGSLSVSQRQWSCQCERKLDSFLYQALIKMHIITVRQINEWTRTKAHKIPCERSGSSYNPFYIRWCVRPSLPPPLVYWYFLTFSLCHLIFTRRSYYFMVFLRAFAPSLLRPTHRRCCSVSICAHNHNFNLWCSYLVVFLQTRFRFLFCADLLLLLLCILVR